LIVEIRSQKPFNPAHSVLLISQCYTFFMTNADQALGLSNAWIFKCSIVGSLYCTRLFFIITIGVNVSYSIIKHMHSTRSTSFYCNICFPPHPHLSRQHMDIPPTAAGKSKTRLPDRSHQTRQCPDLRSETGRTMGLVPGPESRTLSN
jgi:hypothetical protein